MSKKIHSSTNLSAKNNGTIGLRCDSLIATNEKRRNKGIDPDANAAQSAFKLFFTTSVEQELHEQDETLLHVLFVELL